MTAMLIIATCIMGFSWVVRLCMGFILWVTKKTSGAFYIGNIIGLSLQTAVVIVAIWGWR